VHYVPTDKINASIRIHIRQILKVKICIQLMRILTSFVTSLHVTVLLLGYLCCHGVLLGYLSMTDDWFSEYVLEVAIDKKFIPAEMLEILSQQPKVLPAWDPMGSLAGQQCHCHQLDMTSRL